MSKSFYTTLKVLLGITLVVYGLVLGLQTRKLMQLEDHVTYLKEPVSNSMVRSIFETNEDTKLIVAYIPVPRGEETEPDYPTTYIPAYQKLTEVEQYAQNQMIRRVKEKDYLNDGTL